MPGLVAPDGEQANCKQCFEVSPIESADRGVDNRYRNISVIGKNIVLFKYLFFFGKP